MITACRWGWRILGQEGTAKVLVPSAGLKLLDTRWKLSTSVCRSDHPWTKVARPKSLTLSGAGGQARGTSHGLFTIVMPSMPRRLL